MYSILTYEQLKNIESSENDELMVDINKYSKDIECVYVLSDMHDITGEKIYVRDLVARKLASVQNNLQKIMPVANLRIVYGYRHPLIQEKYFVEMSAKLKKEHTEMTASELDSYTHNFIAVPNVAGHPTGGAVDLTITLNGEEIDMGGKIEDFDDIETMITNSNKISNEAKKNRFILHDLMVKENFAPFYGEWWHFSYGDKEWACFYNEEKSIYSPIDFKIINE